MADTPFFGQKLGVDVDEETIREYYHCTRVKVFYPDVFTRLDSIEDPFRCNIYLTGDNMIVAILIK